MFNNNRRVANIKGCAWGTDELTRNRLSPYKIMDRHVDGHYVKPPTQNH